MRFLTLVFAALAGASVPLWGAEAPPLTLEAALRTALEAHPELAAAAHDVAAAQAAVRGAGALPSPEVVVAPLGRVEDAQLSVTQPLALNGERAAGVRAARARLEASEWERRALRNEVVFRVRVAFYEVLAAQEERDAVAETVGILEQIHQAAQQSFALGNAPQTHVVRTRLEWTRAQQELQRAEGEVAARRAALNTAMGRPAETPVRPQGELPRPEGEPDAARLRETALQQRPDLAAAEADVRAREALVGLARAERRPDLLLSAERESLTEGGGSLGVGITLPFLDWGRRRAAVREATAAVDASRARLAQRRNTVALEVEQALVRLRTAASTLRSFEESLLADAGQLAEMTRTGYQEGALSYLEVLDAQRALTETRRGAIQARAAYASARAALDWAVAAPLAEK
ncbi:MAG: TolC family protein [Armatimonadetes bacterium]|nr:TolC family protein [Armatimonadota bacterium]